MANQREYLLATIQDALDEYAEDGAAFDEDDLRDILDNLVRDFEELQKLL